MFRRQDDPEWNAPASRSQYGGRVRHGQRGLCWAGPESRTAGGARRRLYRQIPPLPL